MQRQREETWFRGRTLMGSLETWNWWRSREVVKNFSINRLAYQHRARLKREWREWSQEGREEWKEQILWLRNEWREKKSILHLQILSWEKSHLRTFCLPYRQWMELRRCLLKCPSKRLRISSCRHLLCIECSGQVQWSWSWSTLLLLLLQSELLLQPFQLA